MKIFIEFIISIAIGLSLVCFVGFVYSAIRPAPQMPEMQFIEESSGTETYGQESTDYDNEYREFEKNTAQYNKTSAKIMLGISTLIFLIGLLFAKKSKVMLVFSEGLLMGGILVALYSLFIAVNMNYFMFYPVSNTEPDRITTTVAASAILVMVSAYAYYKSKALSTEAASSRKKK